MCDTQPLIASLRDDQEIGLPDVAETRPFDDPAAPREIGGDWPRGGCHATQVHGALRRTISPCWRHKLAQEIWTLRQLCQTERTMLQTACQQRDHLQSCLNEEMAEGARLALENAALREQLAALRRERDAANASQDGEFLAQSAGLREPEKKRTFPPLARKDGLS